MEVDPGAAANATADATRTARLLDGVATTGAPAVRVWRPPAHLSMGPRDRRSPHYDDAVAEAKARGYPVQERRTGGGPVAFTGDTIAFAVCEPPGTASVRDRYDRVIGALEAALVELGFDVERGEPQHTFCPGTCSLSTDGKVVGLAQRARRDVALVGGVAIAEDPQAILHVLAPVYEALGRKLDPASIGTLAHEGVPVGAIETALERALAQTVRPDQTI